MDHQPLPGPCLALRDLRAFLLKRQVPDGRELSVEVPQGGARELQLEFDPEARACYFGCLVGPEGLL